MHTLIDEVQISIMWILFHRGGLCMNPISCGKVQKNPAGTSLDEELPIGRSVFAEYETPSTPLHQSQYHRALLTQ